MPRKANEQDGSSGCPLSPVYVGSNANAPAQGIGGYDVSSPAACGKWEMV